MQLIALKKINQEGTLTNVSIYHWSPGGCATIESDDWIGYTTLDKSSHPADSQNDFMLKALENPGHFYILANSRQLIIQNMETNNVEVSSTFD